MTTYQDDMKLLHRTAIESDGTILYECDLAASVLPMTDLFLSFTEKPFYVVAVKSRNGIAKGDHYRVNAIWRDGRMQVARATPGVTAYIGAGATIPGLFPMDCFSEILESNLRFTQQVKTEDTIDPPKVKK